MKNYTVDCREIENEKFAKELFSSTVPSYSEAWNLDEQSFIATDNGEWVTSYKEFDSLEEAKAYALSTAYFTFDDSEEDFFKISACFADIFCSDDDSTIKVCIDRNGKKSTDIDLCRERGIKLW